MKKNNPNFFGASSKLINQIKRAQKQSYKLINKIFRKINPLCSNTEVVFVSGMQVGSPLLHGCYFVIMIGKRGK